MKNRNLDCWSIEHGWYSSSPRFGIDRINLFLKGCFSIGVLAAGLSLLNPFSNSENQNKCDGTIADSQENDQTMEYLEPKGFEFEGLSDPIMIDGIPLYKVKLTQEGTFFGLPREFFYRIEKLENGKWHEVNKGPGEFGLEQKIASGDVFKLSAYDAVPSLQEVDSPLKIAYFDVVN